MVVCCNDSIHSLMLARSLPVDLWIADEGHQTEAETMLNGAAVMAPRRAVGFTATPYRSDDKQSLTLWKDVIYSYGIGDALADKVLVPWDVHHWGGEGDATDINAICTRLIKQHAQGPGIVSARSIEDAEEYAEELTVAGVPSEAIHSKLARGSRADLLGQLQAGKLRSLVHVSLLAEGVDLPWLQWLCLRRRVQARVRFVQEVGRVLRTHPGKTRATVIDPYDLFTMHGITHAATLGEPAKKADPVPVEEDPFPLVELPPVDRAVPPAVAVNAVGAWSRALLRLMQTAGLHQPDPKWGKPDARWRRSRASEKQAAALGRMSVWARYMPKEHREAVKAICGCPARLRAGVASDLMDVLSAVASASEADRKRKRHWKWPSVLDVPVLPKRVLVGLGAA